MLSRIVLCLWVKSCRNCWSSKRCSWHVSRRRRAILWWRDAHRSPKRSWRVRRGRRSWVCRRCISRSCVTWCRRGHKRGCWRCYLSWKRLWFWSNCHACDIRLSYVNDRRVRWIVISKICHKLLRGNSVD